MALVLKDRVLETCASPGTGTITLLGTVTGYQSFSTVGNGNTCYYAIADQNGANWEVGIGTYSSGTLARTTVLSSSNAGALTNFSSGTQNVFLTYPSERSVNLSSAALTSGRVAYATTDGLLTDSANLTFDGNTLTSSNATGANFVLNSTAASPYIAFNHSSVSKFLLGSSVVVGGGTGYYDFYGVAGIGQRFWTGASQRMTILSTGEVGIGTGSPATKLVVYDTTAPQVTFDNGTSTFIVGNNVSGNNHILYGTGAYPMIFYTNATEGMRITSAGLVGIGTSSPSALLGIATSTMNSQIVLGVSTSNSAYGSISLNGNSADSGRLGFTGGGTGDNSLYIDVPATTGQYAFRQGATTVMQILSSGNVGINNVSPATKLDVNGTGYFRGLLYVSGSYGITSDAPAPLIFGINGTEKMRLDTSGNLLVGTTSAVDSSKVQISGAKVSSSGIPQGQLNIADTSAIAAGVGGAIAFSALYSGSSYTTMGSVEGVRENGTSGNYAGALVFSTRANGANNNEGMRITSAGNVGIGTTNPIRPLQVGNYGVTNGEIALASTTTGYGTILFGDGASGSDYYRGYVQYNHTSDAMLFATATVEAMRINSTGSVSLTKVGGSAIIRRQNVQGSYGLSVQGNGADTIDDTNPGASVIVGGGPLDDTYEGNVSINAYGAVSASGNRNTIMFTNRSGTNTTQERMRINYLGNVGIGTTDPDYGSYGATERILGVTGVATYRARLSLQNTSTGTTGAAGTVAFFNGSTILGAIDVVADGATNKGFFDFNTNTGSSFTTRMRLTSGGNLLVGTTSNNGRICATYDNADWNFNSNQTGADATKYHVRFTDNLTAVGNITSTGSVTSYNVTSDQRLKTNVVDATSGNIDDIKVRSFDWIADGSHQEYGMIAQELIEVAPYAVTKFKNPNDMMGVDYSKLVPMMIKEIQDLKQRIATLENK